MNNFEKPFNQKEKDWQKSVDELSKFLLDNSGSYSLFEAEEFKDKNEKDKADRLKSRLEELLEKASKRLGYKIDESKLMTDSYRHILALENSGELPPSNLLKNLCAEISKRLDSAA